MKYNLIDRLMWSFMQGACFDVIKKERPNWDIKAIKKEAKVRFREIVEDTPSIGGYMENASRRKLNGGMVWIAIYEIAKEKYGAEMDIELYEKLCRAAISMPMMLKMAKMMDPFSDKQQKNMIKRAEKENKIDSPFNWHTVIKQGKVDEEFTLIYTRCGLCELAKRRGHLDILPAMCRTDYIMIEAMNAILHRDKTLSNGDDCCYYYITKPGSEAERKWQEEHPEGTFKPL